MEPHDEAAIERALAPLIRRHSIDLRTRLMAQSEMDVQIAAPDGREETLTIPLSHYHVWLFRYGGPTAQTNYTRETARGAPTPALVIAFLLDEARTAAYMTLEEHTRMHPHLDATAARRAYLRLTGHATAIRRFLREDFAAFDAAYMGR